ncbi:MAG: hypothetical protein IJU29_02470 [Oscillospiraceae bacterium]|nr:hypothetical protein [Oscillospiraceae bacterium]
MEDDRRFNGNGERRRETPACTYYQIMLPNICIFFAKFFPFPIISGKTAEKYGMFRRVLSIIDRKNPGCSVPGSGAAGE